MVDFLQSVDSDNGPREPTPVTIVSGGTEVKPVQASGPQSSANSTSVTQASDAIFREQIIGRANLTTSQASVTTTASQIAAARSGRDSVMVTNLGTVDVWLGPSGVTTATGDLLSGVKGAVKSYPYAGALFAVTASGTANVSVVDVY